jgi:hypothetical protein
VPVIASALNDLPASFEQIAATQSNIGRMRAAGVEVAIGMIDDNDTRYMFNERQYAGNLVALNDVPGASGVPWGEALAMITWVCLKRFTSGLNAKESQLAILKKRLVRDSLSWKPLL